MIRFSTNINKGLGNPVCIEGCPLKKYKDHLNLNSFNLILTFGILPCQKNVIFKIEKNKESGQNAKTFKVRRNNFFKFRK